MLFVGFSQNQSGLTRECACASASLAKTPHMKVSPGISHSIRTPPCLFSGSHKDQEIRTDEGRKWNLDWYREEINPSWVTGGLF